MTDSPLLYLYGNDEFAIARRLDELQSALDLGGMSTTRLEARTVSDEELNNAVNAAPFMGGKRLVFLANPSTRTSVPAAREKFASFLLAAPSSTLVVMYETLEPRDEARHWLVKRAEKGEFPAERFMLPRAWEMTGWILNEARSMDGRIEQPAAARLAEMVGENTRQAAQELTKLLTYVNSARPINLADVEAVSVVSAQGDVFALVDALGTGDGKKAQKVLHRLLEEEDAMALWGMVIRQFRLLLQAKEILEDRGSKFEVQQTLGLHEFVAGKITDQARRFTMPALESIYHKLLEMDEGAKTSQVPLDLALDTFIVELTRK
jgi:DNA polymerase-3 subunit delta